MEAEDRAPLALLVDILVNEERYRSQYCGGVQCGDCGKEGGTTN